MTEIRAVEQESSSAVVRSKIKKQLTAHGSQFTDSKGFTPHLCKSAGFTIIEIAIVLVVIGLLVTLGISLIGPLTKRVKYTESKEIVNAAVESINSYAAGNNKLPDTSGFSTAVRNSNDAFSKALVYIYDSNLAASPATKDTICGRKTTSYTICRDASCTAATNIPNVAFVVISGAENYNIQAGTLTGGVCPSGQTCVKVYESGTQNIDDYPTDVSRQEDYDDIVKWATLDELRTKAGCKGAQLKIVNNELPSGRVGSSYSVTFFADAGVSFADGLDSGTDPDYEWCWSSASTLTDLTFTCNGALAKSSTCSPSPSVGTWNQCTSIVISGIPNGAPGAGSHNIKVYVRDNGGNTDQKPFVLTINPQT